MKKLLLGIAAISASALVGCGSDSIPTPTPDAGPSFTQPTGTVAVNFKVDDSANKLFAAGDLQWKGAMKYDPTTRIITADATWGGPFAVLYDDGPWTTGGHEPVGATAADGIWGVTIFVAPPATGTAKYGYGLQDAHSCAAAATTCNANGWSWLGDNGEFDIAAGATAAVNATGRSFPKFGTTDLQLTATLATLDSYCNLTAPATCAVNADCGDITKYQCANTKCALKARQKCTGAVACPTGTGATVQACVAPDTTKVTVKSSAFTWNEVQLTNTAGAFTFTLSALAGAGKTLPHSGQLNSGDKPEFLFVFNGNEYRDYSATGTPASTVGVTAGLKATGAANYTTATINVLTNGNTSITVP